MKVDECVCCSSYSTVWKKKGCGVKKGVIQKDAFCSWYTCCACGENGVILIVIGIQGMLYMVQYVFNNSNVEKLPRMCGVLQSVPVTHAVFIWSDIVILDSV